MSEKGVRIRRTRSRVGAQASGHFFLNVGMRRHTVPAWIHRQEKVGGGGTERRWKVSGELLKGTCEAKGSGGGRALGTGDIKQTFRAPNSTGHSPATRSVRVIPMICGLSFPEQVHSRHPFNVRPCHEVKDIRDMLRPTDRQMMCVAPRQTLRCALNMRLFLGRGSGTMPVEAKSVPEEDASIHLTVIARTPPSRGLSSFGHGLGKEDGPVHRKIDWGFRVRPLLAY
jgi:hypothetical protein